MTKEIYYYEDFPSNEVVIGTRGVSEYRVSRPAFMREVMRLRADTRNIPEEYLKIAIKLSQYVEFEEVKPNILLLGVENYGGKTNETK